MHALLKAVLYLSALLENNPPVVAVLKDGAPHGAAVIVDARGYLVSCGHVIGRRQRVAILFRDGGKLTAAVVAQRTQDDLVLLKIDSEMYKFLPAVLAGPATVREPVTVLGHPHGYLFTYTTGIVSAVNRTIPMPDGEPVHGLIQTDAAMNGGNSGGALFDVRGRLLGIPLALREGARGLAFAVPASAVKRLMADHLPKED